MKLINAPLILHLALCLLTFKATAQGELQWDALPNMPEAVANNAVTSAYCGDTLCVYSFCGIGSGLEPADIHLHAWRYNTSTGVWNALPDVPDTQGLIASGASTINNRIYVIGGYHVNANFSEVSSSSVHVFDPESNTWLEDAASIPTAIDDHVQAVWSDSLLFVVTGWSNTGNVNKVQIFNPSLNTWEQGTVVPNSNGWKAFGASGVFIGDTLYYMGGVNGASFAATSLMRKGVVNPDNPLEISWDLLDDYPGDPGYRMACAQSGDCALWIGGSSVAYNFDAVAYNGSGVVAPNERVAVYNASTLAWSEYMDNPAVMDLRGIARVSDHEWIICGGIGEDQEVLQQTWLLTFSPETSISEVHSEMANAHFKGEQLVVHIPEGSRWQLLDLSGRKCSSGRSSGSFEVQCGAGVYVFIVHLPNGMKHSIKLLKGGGA
ncbi:MAG: hypothetical protein KDC12_05460 [Flavobacteriales bacterium]|nr:hypothetical protein [Flavobacteriales bacterium]